MKIGFYKPFIKVYFHDDRLDFNATSYEVTNVMKIFAERGHKCYMLSDSDLKDGKIKNINRGTIDCTEQYDRIYLYGGPYKLFNQSNAEIKHLRRITNELFYILTDMRCTPPNDSDYELFDKFYSQSINKFLFGQKNTYGGVAEFRCYKMKLKEVNENILKEKKIKIYFGGTTRGRLTKYLEYVYRPNVLLTGKSEELGFNNRITRDKYLDTLKKTKYSIVFADVDYEKNNFITPRYYENTEANIFSFFDNEFDRGQKLINKNDWRKVSSYLEWMDKINALERNKYLYLQYLVEQQKDIKREYINGDYVYEILK